MTMGTTEAKYPRNFHFSLSLRKAPDGAELGLPADGHLCDHQGEAQAHHQNEIYQEGKMPPPYFAAR